MALGDWLQGLNMAAQHMQNQGKRAYQDSLNMVEQNAAGQAGSPPSRHSNPQQLQADVDARQREVFMQYLQKAWDVLGSGEQPSYGHDERSKALNQFYNSEYGKLVRAREEAASEGDGYHTGALDLQLNSPSYSTNYSTREQAAKSRLMLRREPNYQSPSGGMSPQRGQIMYPPSSLAPPYARGGHDPLPLPPSLGPMGTSEWYAEDQRYPDYYMLLVRHLMEMDGLDPTKAIPDQLRYSSAPAEGHKASEYLLDLTPYKANSPSAQVDALRGLWNILPDVSGGKVKSGKAPTKKKKSGNLGSEGYPKAKPKGGKK